MSYFEVPPQPEPHDGIIEEWYSAPDDELGTEIGINKLLATHHPQFMHPHGTERALSFWIWSIPVQGDVTVVCEWVAAEIPVVRFILEGDELREAARRSEKLW